MPPIGSDLMVSIRQCSSVTIWLDRHAGGNCVAVDATHLFHVDRIGVTDDQLVPTDHSEPAGDVSRQLNGSRLEHCDHPVRVLRKDGRPHHRRWSPPLPRRCRSRPPPPHGHHLRRRGAPGPPGPGPPPCRPSGAPSSGLGAVGRPVSRLRMRAVDGSGQVGAGSGPDLPDLHPCLGGRQPGRDCRDRLRQAKNSDHRGGMDVLALARVVEGDVAPNHGYAQGLTGLRDPLDALAETATSPPASPDCRN